MQKENNFNVTEQEIDKVVTYLINSNKEYLNENEISDIDEGLLAKVVGALGGTTLGNKILVKIAEMLGLAKGSILYNLLTSKVFSGTLGAFVADNVSKSFK